MQVSWPTFSEWNRRNSVEKMAEKLLADAREERRRKAIAEAEKKLQEEGAGVAWGTQRRPSSG